MGDFTDYDELTWLATIIGVHGVSGSVRAKYFTKTPEYYLGISDFFVEIGKQLHPHKVLRIYPAKKFWIILFENIDSRNLAENLRGCRLLLPDKQLKPLENNEFFVHQLIGCNVEDQNGCFLGIITNLLETSANNVYEVQNGKSEFLVPDVPDVVLELDIKKQRMVINPIPGLI